MSIGHEGWSTIPECESCKQLETENKLLKDILRDIKEIARKRTETKNMVKKETISSGRSKVIKIGNIYNINWIDTHYLQCSGPWGEEDYTEEYEGLAKVLILDLLNYCDVHKSQKTGKKSFSNKRKFVKFKFLDFTGKNSKGFLSGLSSDTNKIQTIKLEEFMSFNPVRN